MKSFWNWWWAGWTFVALLALGTFGHVLEMMLKS
jgi:hypothetical protein